VSARSEREQAAMKVWVDRQLAKATPFNERQKMLIRTAFAAERGEHRGAA
jgi:hypothetical protein